MPACPPAAPLPSSPHAVVDPVPSPLSTLAALLTLAVPAAPLPRRQPITCGAWSDENTLCLGGKDNTISVTNENGDTIQQPQLHGEPSNIQFYSPLDDPDEQTISILIDNQTLYLWKSVEPENPIELEFQVSGEIDIDPWSGPANGAAGRPQ